MSGEPLLRVDGLTVRFELPATLPWRRRKLTALDGVGFTLEAGRTLGVVGESGCGKSTLARAIVGTVRPAGGEIRYRGELLVHGPGVGPRREIRQVFQDPRGSLDPRMTVAGIVAEPLRAAGPRLAKAEIAERVARMLQRVGLSPGDLHRYPHEFSGGQCQRIGIARALVGEPRLLVCDEPVSALDVSIRAQVINLLTAIQADSGVAMLFIAHDLGIVRHVSDRVMVLYLGRVMEILPADSLPNESLHPYTRALLAAEPVADPGVMRGRRRASLDGEPPSPLAAPAGCVFQQRCAKARAECRQRRPDLEQVAPGHQVACHLVRD